MIKFLQQRLDDNQPRMEMMKREISVSGDELAQLSMLKKQLQEAEDARKFL